MNVYIDNTGILRLSDVTLTTLSGTSELMSDAGEFTVTNSDGEEVSGQSWPTSLTLLEAGSYAGIIESDLSLQAGRLYYLVVSIGSDPESKYKIKREFIAKSRME